ncbi:MAG: UvrD-helicase domain-containing protein, partial [Rhodothermales bacterium]|nr:UvrD-helicase domain-containing protein [Rhodothermales bacterium]
MVHSLISGAKNRMVSPSQYAQMAASPAQEIAARIFQPYQDKLRVANAMDFDDLLLRPIELFQGHANVLDRYQNMWRHVHIDEYQDTNHAQYVLAKMLAGPDQNICVVGDDAQSIYAFRGADIGNILSFQKDYPAATTIRLEQNYRSTKRIVQLADSIIRHNKDQLKKDLWTENDDGDPILVIEALSERDEAQKIERRIRDIQLRLGLLYEDFAVLYRTNAQSRSFEDALRRGGIPYRVIGGMSFYQRREIKDAVAYLRLVVNANDTASFRRVINTPTRGIGDKTQQQISAFADREGIGIWDALERLDEGFLTPRATKAVTSFKDMIEAARRRVADETAVDLARGLIQESGLLEEFRKEHTPENLARWENIQELLNAISEFSESADESYSLSAFLQEISLLTDADENEPSENRVTLMTLHASKGLEFPVVFLSGLEEGLFPLAAATQDRNELEEERRLFYVGATRAERLLMLSHARSRYRFGEQQSAIRSRFFEEIDPTVLRTEAGQLFEKKADRLSLKDGLSVTYEELDPHYYRKSLRSTTPTADARRVVFDEEESGEIVPGMRVEHVQFGEGKVISKEGRGDQTKAIVYFRDVGQKKLLLKFAHLKRIG